MDRSDEPIAFEAKPWELMLCAQRLENIGMLAAGIAHEFNNALAPLVMGCQLWRMHVSDPGGQSQLLQVRHVLREVIDLAEATFPKSIHVDSHLPADLWPVGGGAALATALRRLQPGLPVVAMSGVDTALSRSHAFAVGQRPAGGRAEPCPPLADCSRSERARTSTGRCPKLVEWASGLPAAAPSCIRSLEEIRGQTHEYGSQ